MYFNVQLDDRKFTKKPTSSEVPAIYHNLKLAITDIPSFANALEQGQTFRAAVVGKDLSFLSQQVFALDFDGVPIDSMLAIAKETGIYPAIIYHTFSQPAGEPVTRFRMVFVSDHPITDRGVRDAIMQKLMQMYENYCDTHCKDTSRMFYGGRTVTYREDCIYNFEELWAIPRSTGTVTKK